MKNRSCPICVRKTEIAIFNEKENVEDEVPVYDKGNVKDEDIEDIDIGSNDDVEDDNCANIMTIKKKHKEEESKLESPSHGILHVPGGEPHMEKPKKRISFQETVLTDSGKEIPLLPPGHIRPRYQRLLTMAYKRLSDCCSWCCNLSEEAEEDFMPPIEDIASQEELMRRKKELFSRMFEKYISPSSSLESIEESEERE